MAEESVRFLPATGPADELEQEIARVCALSVAELRSTWRTVFRSEPPSAFSKDLLIRAICLRRQEQVLGGLASSAARSLRSALAPGGGAPRAIKIGSVIVREHKGVVHQVLVVPGGFRWRDETYESLSAIAKKITGVSWSGPRFFGLRPNSSPVQQKAEAVPTEALRRASRRDHVTDRGAEPSPVGSRS